MDLPEYEQKTRDHIQLVNQYGNVIVQEIAKMLKEHDASKLESPEKEIFANFMDTLKTVKIGTPEYDDMIFKSGLKEAIKHHHQHNRHHPEYFENGMSGMTIMDIVVWIVDVMASAHRDNNDPIKSMGTDICQKRFGYDDMLKTIMTNTVKFVQNREVNVPSTVPTNDTTKVYMDLEFTSFDKINNKIISIGLVDEYGRTFYGVMNDYDSEDVNPWVVENVIPYLDADRADIHGPTWQVRARLEEWLSAYPKIEMWGDCIAYDWVLFNDLWKDSQSIPNNVSYIPQDLCTLLKICNVDPDVSREQFVGIEGGAKHNAKHDALVIKKCCEKCWDMLSSGNVSFNRK